MSACEVTPANAILFSDLCAVLEQIHKKKPKKQEQEKILAAFINEFRINVGKIVGKKYSTIFPVLRLLLPDKERERAAYNLKEKTLGQLLVKVLSLSKESRDAQKLLNFRSVSTSQESDFAGVVYFVLKNRVGKKSGTLTIGDINEILDRIATAEVGNKGPARDEAFSYALKNLSAEQMKWFLRIILKDLKLGIGVDRILGAFHPDAPDLFNSCGNLSKVCEELEDGDTRPLELGIKVFYAVSPMLSERLDVTKTSQLPAGTYQVEAKYDGERFQMHMENGVFEYFSRKGFKYSDSYGKTYDSGLLTPMLKDCFSPSVNSVILDGEMMGWHKQHQCFGSKGMAFDVKKITENSKFRPCFCVFDILYINGKSLVGPPDKGGIPLSKRLDILKNLFTDIRGVIMHSEYAIVNNRHSDMLPNQFSTDILEALNKAIDNQEEGIVVKDTESYYIANKRNAGWYKIKPEYTSNTMEDLDLVIIGADEAENKRQGRARSFHVACADAVDEGEPHRWVDVGKVATGLTFEERERICALLEKQWVPWKRALPPPNIVFSKEKPDFWIKPQHSIVVTVRATELIRSTDFATEYTLRFPRIVKIRDDKPIKDTMRLDKFKLLVAEKGPVIKLGQKRVNEDQLDGIEIKTRRKRETKALEVPEQFRTKVSGEVQVTSQALAGRKIYIITDDEDCKKPELVRIVESHGGKHVENIGPDTWCCIVGRMTYRARTLINTKEQDIISTAWLRSLPASEVPCSLSPLDMYSIKKQTKLMLSRRYDRFGDSYTEEIDEDTLKKLIKKIDSEEPEIYPTNNEMLSLDYELFGISNPFSFLRSCYIYFTVKNTLQELKARMYGANVCELDSPNLTHVVVFKDQNNECIEHIKGGVHKVNEDWLEKCFDAQKIWDNYEGLSFCDDVD